MGDDFWQPTAEAFEQIFQKPKMTQKLLSKPPFRYLHDIFTATCGATGFGNGLYSGDELNAKLITEKDAKINFLVKLIQLVELVVGEEMDVKPTKVVAGHEPEKTNLFLQALFRAATAGIDTSPHVQQILGGGAADDGAGQGGDDQEEAMRQQMEEQAAQEQAAAAEAEAEERKRAEQEARRKKKKDADRRRKEEEQLRIQEEEAERQRQEESEANQMRQMQEQQQRIQEQQNNQQLIRDGDVEDEQPMQQDDDEEQFQQRPQFQDEGKSKLVQEAKAMMNDGEDDDKPAVDENAGPKIKMGRIGKKKKTKGAEGAKAGGAGADSGFSKPKSQVPDEMEDRGQEGFTEGDIEFMRQAIQILCRSTNPLGKSIDFVTDDVDSMSKEYEHWRKEAITCNQQLEDAQKTTEEVIQPLQDSLAELEEKIREQQAKVNSTRAQILRNDITVNNLLSSVIMMQ